MSQFVFFNYYCVVVDLFQSWKKEEERMDSNGNENETQVGSTTTCGSERKDPRWKYARLPNEQDLNAIIYIFCDKVTKGDIYRHKQHLVGGHRNAKKCTKCPVHVRQEMKDYMNGKKNQKKQLKMRNEGLYEDFEDIDGEVESRRVASNITRGGSNRGRGSVKRSREKERKGQWIIFFTPNVEAVVKNRSGKMTQTTMNDAYKKEAREKACYLISRWMYAAAIPFNAVTYPSFQPMIEAIGQYGVGMKGPNIYEVRVTHLKKELELTKDSMKDHEMERMDAPIGKEELW